MGCRNRLYSNHCEAAHQVCIRPSNGIGEIGDMNWSRVREKTAAIVVILFVIVLGIIGLGMAGVRIPILSDIIARLFFRG